MHKQSSSLKGISFDIFFGKVACASFAASAGSVRMTPQTVLTSVLNDRLRVHITLTNCKRSLIEWQFFEFWGRAARAHVN